MTDFKKRIRKAEDVIHTENIIVTIFGDPNMGKTSIGFTSESPLHLDYDKGVQRSVGRKDSLDIESWQDGIDLLESSYIEENGIKTLLVDTVGTMLDNYCSRFVIDENPKNGKQGGGLAIGGYGAIKDKFTFFCMKAKAKKVDIVFLCHSADEKEDDKIKKIAKITGGSYDIVKQASDLIGFMESRGNKRTLDFNTTDRHDGKNCPEFPLFVLPHFTSDKWPTYLAEIIAETKKHMNKMSDQQREAVETLTKFRDQINESQTLETLYPIKELISALNTPVKIQLDKIYDDKFVLIWSEEFISPLSTAEDFNSIIKTIEAVEEKYIKPLKINLVRIAKEKQFVYIKDKGFESTKKVEAKAEKTTTKKEKA